MARADILVKGKVQGVGYRNWSYSQAKLHGLRGWVKNTVSGDVAIRAQGSKEQLEAFIDELKIGPALAKVTLIEVTWGADEESPLGEFEILRERI